MNAPAAVGPVPFEEYEALIQFTYLAPVGLAQTTLDGTIVMINPVCAQLLLPLALSREGGLSNLFDALQSVAPDLALRVRRFGDQQGKVCDGLQVQVDAGVPGRRDPQVLSLTLLKLDAGRLMAVIDDVSLAVKRERELRHSQAWIHTIINSVTDYALVSLDREGRIQGANTGIRQVTGFEAEAVVGRPYAIFFREQELPPYRVAERLNEADLSGWNLEEGWLHRANGQRYWGSSLIAPLRAEDGTPVDDRAYSLIIRDIDDRREASEALRRSVWCDHLTGLANRSAFFEAATPLLQRCARAGSPLAVVAFDADHFKAINDNHGHATGDAVLRHLAAGLTATFRSSDIVARFGGEEFVVLMPGASADDACAVAQRLCRHIGARPFAVDGTAIAYTVSAGVAAAVPGETGLDTLLKRADAALYAAKAKGRNRVERCQAGLEPHQAQRVGRSVQ